MRSRCPWLFRRTQKPHVCRIFEKCWPMQHHLFARSIGCQRAGARRLGIVQCIGVRMISLNSFRNWFQIQETRCFHCCYRIFPRHRHLYIYCCLSERTLSAAKAVAFNCSYSCEIQTMRLFCRVGWGTVDLKRITSQSDTANTPAAARSEPSGGGRSLDRAIRSTDWHLHITEIVP